MLANLLLGILWFQNPEAKKYAIGLGCLLGVSQAFHNGLFILQLPLLLTVFILWLQGNVFLKNIVKLFSVALIFSTFITLIPSETFRMNYFSYYHHSWFHLYIAFCSSLALIFMNYTKRTYITVCLLFVICGSLSFPLVNEVVNGVGFIVGDSPKYGLVDEFRKPIAWDKEALFFVKADVYSYTGLLVLLPLSIIILFIWQFYKKDNYKLYVLISFLFGMELLLYQ